jgi:serine/threonine protein kinase
MPLASGTKLGPFEILSPLGAGGMGEVYRAQDTRLGRIVAIKVLPEHLAQRPDIHQRLENEARTISQLSHPNICTLHDIGCEGGTHFLVLEFVEGETLRHGLASGRLVMRKIISIAVQAAEGLAKAHESGIVHRDLKPENLMVSGDALKILDFGLAKLDAPSDQANRQLRHCPPCDSRGHRTWNCAIHVPGAGHRPRARFPLRSIFPGINSLRNGHGHPPVPPEDRHANASGHRRGRASAHPVPQFRDSSAVLLGGGTLPGQGAGESLFLHA